MPMIQIIVDINEYNDLLKVKDKHGHTWLQALKIYADIYDQIEPKKEEH